MYVISWSENIIGGMCLSVVFSVFVFANTFFFFLVTYHSLASNYFGGKKRDNFGLVVFLKKLLN